MLAGNAHFFCDYFCRRVDRISNEAVKEFLVPNRDPAKVVKSPVTAKTHQCKDRELHMPNSLSTSPRSNPNLRSSSQHGKSHFHASVRF